MEKIRVVGSGHGDGDGVEEMARLKTRHDEIEKRLTELERHLSLTPAEQVERVELKKEKLRAKDRLVQLSAGLRQAS